MLPEELLYMMLQGSTCHGPRLCILSRYTGNTLLLQAPAQAQPMRIYGTYPSPNATAHTSVDPHTDLGLSTSRCTPLRLILRLVHTQPGQLRRAILAGRNADHPLSATSQA